MSAEAVAVKPASPSRGITFWIGWILSVLPAPLLFMSASFKLMKPQMVVDGFAKLGIPLAAATPIGIIEILITVLYLIPQTAVLGAILLTGYLGGAICTHVIGGDSWLFPFLMGVVLWLGLYLRDERIRALVPLRKL